MNTLRNLTALNAASVALALSDGTPVEFVKVTSKDNIQVRLPDSHPYAAGQDNGRIFRRDGTHYKDATPLTLVATPAAAAPAAPAPAADPVAASNDSANDNVTYVVQGQDFDSFDDARQEAIDIFVDNGGQGSVEIVAITRKVIGTVGFTKLAA